jgi:hypothetical protein
VFRCAEGIAVERAGERRWLASIADYDELGGFPSATRDGRIAWAGTPRGGRPAAFVDGEVVAEGFASVRGALAGDPVVVFATPAGGTLGVYVGARRWFGLGDALLGSTVVDFALNPVSRADAGWVVARVRLADGMEAIVRR